MTHSFPTRRSSDLRPLAAAGARQPRPPDPGDPEPGEERRRGGAEGGWRDHALDALPAGRAPGDPRHRQPRRPAARGDDPGRSEEHTSELQSLMRISYAVFCLKKKK